MKKILTTPIKAEDLEDIRVGDVIYLTGTLVTCRDVCPPPSDRTQAPYSLRSQWQSDFPRRADCA